MLADTSVLRAPADEIDAIGTKRYEAQSGGEREIQRTMLELLNQLDGFDSMGDVKVLSVSRISYFRTPVNLFYRSRPLSPNVIHRCLVETDITIEPPMNSSLNHGFCHA